MKVDRWEEYQTFFQLIILRYLVVWFSLVPIIAGIINQLPTPLPITLMGVTHSIELTLPFHWQLLWLSSLSFVIALGLFKLFCPKFVQKYSSFSEYSSYDNHPRWLAWEAHGLLKGANIYQKKKLVERLSKKKYLTKLEVNLDKDLCDEPKVNETQTVIQFRVDGQSYEFGMPIVQTTDDESSEKDVFYELFGRYSESYYAVRCTIKILLIISLVLFLWVLGQHICHGAGFVWEWILEVSNK
ncbi:hypothetical protein [Vibrio parahaemolyticus]|uniref:hypothetical protein n=1 Tax=Vibrio parahaemolyticus TaxID=670 RepID=UPI001E3C6547|nr:hypothetical protein [Vibrio parahaemolyticus]MDS1790616.1 hypothetical protein [Vibrio parahaemolyticus]HCE3212127.1 hypothetical protein [Vibrio parahaemolyticus]